MPTFNRNREVTTLIVTITKHRMPYIETMQGRTESVLRCWAITDMIVGDEILGRRVSLPVLIEAAQLAHDYLLAIAEDYYVVSSPEDYCGRAPEQYPLAWLPTLEERRELDRLAVLYPASGREKELAQLLHAFLLTGDHALLPADRTEDEVAEALRCAVVELSCRAGLCLPDWPSLRDATAA